MESVGEIRLWYGVYGDGFVFPVEIERHANIYGLVKAIFAAERYNDRFTFPPSALTLRLARKNNAWVMRNDMVDELLCGEVDSQFEKMDLGRKLSDDAYFGMDFQPGDGQLHILVERPGVKKPSPWPRGLDDGRPCQKFLDAIARHLWDEYDFDLFYEVFPTMGDVLRAVEDGTWSVRETFAGSPTTSTAMPDCFTQNEWEQLQKLHAITTRRTHDGRVCSTFDDKSLLVLPHCMASEEAAETFTAIAAKAKFWALVVVDEAEIQRR